MLLNLRARGRKERGGGGGAFGDGLLSYIMPRPENMTLLERRDENSFDEHKGETIKDFVLLDFRRCINCPEIKKKKN